MDTCTSMCVSIPIHTSIYLYIYIYMYIYIFIHVTYAICRTRFFFTRPYIVARGVAGLPGTKVVRERQPDGDEGHMERRVGCAVLHNLQRKLLGISIKEPPPPHLLAFMELAGSIRTATSQLQLTNLRSSRSTSTKATTYGRSLQPGTRPRINYCVASPGLLLRGSVETVIILVA